MLENWHEDYDGNLRIILPDTYGTEGFLKRAPTGSPPGPASASTSALPEEGAETAIAWWKSHGQDPREKLVIFSDGLDVDRIEALYHRFHGRVRVSFGWGTLLTNDFRGLAPGDALAPFSLVCKAVARRRPPDGQALGQPRQGDRARPPRSSATSGSSGSARRWRSRCWCKAGSAVATAADPVPYLRPA